MSTATSKLARYEVRCEWKGQTATFHVIHNDYSAACQMAYNTCKKATGLPKSSVVSITYLDDHIPEPEGTGHMDLGILRRQREQILHSRKI